MPGSLGKERVRVDVWNFHAVGNDNHARLREPMPTALKIPNVDSNAFLPAIPAWAFSAMLMRVILVPIEFAAEHHIDVPMKPQARD